MTREWERAARAGDADGLRRMLAAGADVDARDRRGQTALMLAAHGGHEAAVEALIAAGADLDVAAKYGLTALMLAIVAGHAGAALALVRAGAETATRGAAAPASPGRRRAISRGRARCPMSRRRSTGQQDAEEGQLGLWRLRPLPPHPALSPRREREERRDAPAAAERLDQEDLALMRRRRMSTSLRSLPRAVVWAVMTWR